MVNTPNSQPVYFHGTAPKVKANSGFAARLKKEIRGDVRFDEASRGRYSTDASIYQIMPVGVVVPRDESDVRVALQIAGEFKVPVLPRGAATSQCGQTVGEALVIDVSKWLTGIIDFDKEAGAVTVEPGVVLDHLNAWLKPNHLWFPVDVSTSAQATIGGMAGNNSCGTRSLKYGNMVHNVLGIDAILADGTEAHFGPLKTFNGSERLRKLADCLSAIAASRKSEIERAVPKVLRRVGGYNIDIFHPQSERPYTLDNSVNLAHLLIGSEGTLAYSRRISLKLASIPRDKTLGVVNFTSMHQAMELTPYIVKLNPCAVELVDRTMIDLSQQNAAFRPVIERALIGQPESILLVEFAGQEKGPLLQKLKDLVSLMGDLGLPGSVVEMSEHGLQRELWEVRKAALNIMMSMKGDGKPVSFIEDCAVPLEHLAEYTDRLTEVFLKHGTRGTWYAHASVGTLHVRPILDMRRDGRQKMRAIAEEAAALVREYKGAYSGEHGDGLCRGEWVAWQFGPQLNQAFQEIKQLFDPGNLFNPGKIVRTPRMDDASLMRFPPAYRVQPLQPKLDWSEWNVQCDPVREQETAPGAGGDPAGGLAKAVEMCNNNGHCRKFDAGTMCPSYRITKDEEHSTRGRANTLRLALSGQLGDGFASKDVKESLDLCVSCKGCKRECPTGVDMAKMKIEFLAAYTQEHGVALRDKLFAYLPRYAPVAARLRRLLNLRNHVPLLAGLQEKLCGVSARRSLPPWTLPFSAKAKSRAAPKDESKEVLLFVDTFNNYFEPANAVSAMQVLEALGYRVRLSCEKKLSSRPLCCGRTFLAAGLVDEAKVEAKRLLDALLPYVERGIAVIGLEPSCLLTLRDEFLDYGYGKAAGKLSEGAYLFEEFLAKEYAAGRVAPAFKSLPYTLALLHGHCHQKAFDAVKPIRQVLSWVPGLITELIESSCCGMAGAFGYEAEHIEASLQMAELSLFPSIRNSDPNALIIADGTSCRHQIRDGLGREAMHVVRVLDMALA